MRAEDDDAEALGSHWMMGRSGGMSTTESPGDIEVSCPACGQKSVASFDRLEAETGLVCTGCGKTVTVGIDQIAKAIKAGQKALNATIRGIKRKPK